MNAITTPRPSVMQLAIKEKAALYAAYIPLFTEGGIFVPTQRDVSRCARFIFRIY